MSFMAPNYGGGTFFTFFPSKLGDRLDAQVFLGVVLYDKIENIKKKMSKLNFYPPVGR